MSDSPLREERRGQHVVLLTLDVPERRNAMVAALTAAWAETVAELAADSSVRAVVVTGEGSSFCAGGDLSWIAESPDQSVAAIRERMLPFYRTWLSIRDLAAPVLAAVNGPAVGAGMCLALACDLRYALDDCDLQRAVRHLGMHAGMAATYLLPELIGIGPSRDLLYTGRSVDAAEALRPRPGQRLCTSRRAAPRVPSTSRSGSPPPRRWRCG